MIKEAFLRIMREYPKARNKSIANHEIAHLISFELPNLFTSVLDIKSKYSVIGSAGKGKWAACPWIAFYNPIITTTAQKGYYPVYLFSYNMDRVYLSFNQGVSLLIQEFSKLEAKSILNNRADIFRSRLHNDYFSYFPDQQISLEADRNYSISKSYEAGHAFGICYYIDSMPESNIMIEDLRKMLSIYDKSILLGGFSLFDEEFDDVIPEDAMLEEKRLYRYHRKLERNSANAMKAKVFHGYTCQVCGINFREKYGIIGEGFIEAHHKIPLHLLNADYVLLSVRSDFAVVCSNCHSMIHRKGAPDTFEKFVDCYRTINRN